MASAVRRAGSSRPPAKHRLAHRRVRVKDLADEPWIVGCMRCREHVFELCAEAGFEPRVQHTTDDYVLVQNLVVRGLGVTLLPDMALQAFRHPDAVVQSSKAWGRRTCGIVHRDGADQVPATAALLHELGAA